MRSRSQFPTERRQSVDPVRDRPRVRDMFTNEADWSHVVLDARVPAPTPGATP